MADGMGTSGAYVDYQRDLARETSDAAALSSKPLAAWLNPSGMHPTERKVLVRPDPPRERTEGGVYLPDSSKDREKYQQIVGLLIACAPLAFDYASDEAWQAVNGIKPKAGDRVMYAKNAGGWVKGKDGKDYLMLNDIDVTSTVDEDF